MQFKRRRRIVALRNQIETLRLNPFVVSRLFFSWVLIGVMGGLIAGLYWLILEGLTNALSVVDGVWVIALMTAAGLLAGLVIHFIGDPGEMNLIVNNIRFKGGRLASKNNPSMFLSSLICIASGGSLGPEAPLVQITGSTGTWLARTLKIKGEDIRTLTIAGMASGFTALFGAPLGGSLFALEILHHKHVAEYYQAIIPALVASCSSFVVFVAIAHIGIGPAWNFTSLPGTSITNFFVAIAIALPAVAIGWVFIYAVRKLHHVFKFIKQPAFIKMALGGLLIGILVYFFPITRYFSHHEIPQLLEGNFSLPALIMILLVKLLVIALTVSSGWRGGFIIPLFFVGAALGLIIHELFPATNLSLAMVSCMAAIIACVTRTPLSVIILLSAMTGFHHFIPIIFASLTGFFLAPKTPLINAQLAMEKEA